MRVPQQSVNLMPEIEFMKMALPKKFGESSLFLCPQFYKEMMEMRNQKFREVQMKIKQANLTNE